MVHLRLEPLLPTIRRRAEVIASLIEDAPNAAVIGEELAGAIDGQLSLYERTSAIAPWIGYLAREEGSGNLLGCCSFIGKPDEGSVEIAYFTFRAFEGQGVATPMAAELLRIAAQGGAAQLHAFTLPEPNRSTGILQKLGFIMVGEDEDEDAGRVWRWERGSA